MHQRVTGCDNIGRLPDRTQIADLLRRYSEPLLSSCPSSETLVVYYEDPEQLSAAEREALDDHLGICLDCRDKLRWLEESETASYAVYFARVIWYVLRVRHPTGVEVAGPVYSGGGAVIPASRTPPSEQPGISRGAGVDRASAPYVVSGDGALFGDIRQDRYRRIYFRMTRLPRSFQWHALHIRALTFDRRVLVSGTRTISGPKFHIDHPPRIKPGDLDQVELGLIPLR